MDDIYCQLLPSPPASCAPEDLVNINFFMAKVNFRIMDGGPTKRYENKLGCLMHARDAEITLGDTFFNKPPRKIVNKDFSILLARLDATLSKNECRFFCVLAGKRVLSMVDKALRIDASKVDVPENRAIHVDGFWKEGPKYSVSTIGLFVPKVPRNVNSDYRFIPGVEASGAPSRLFTQKELKRFLGGHN